MRWTSYKIKYFIEKLKGESIGVTFVRGTSGAFLINVTGTFISFCVQILLTRIMGADNYGIYIYVINWCVLFVLLSKLGLDSAILRFIPLYSIQKEWNLFFGIIKKSKEIQILTSIVISSIIFFIVWLIRKHLGFDLALTFIISCIMLPILTSTHLNLAILRALLHPIKAQFPIAVLRPTLIGVFAVIIYFGIGRKINGPFAAILYLFSSIIILALTIFWVKKCYQKTEKNVLIKYRTREWLNVALPLMLLSGMQISMNKTDVIMIGIFLGTTEAGIYSIAARIAMFILFGLNAVEVIIAPIISSLYGTDEYKKLQKIITLESWGLLTFSLPVALIFIVGGKKILGIFGHEFIIGYTALSILSIAQLINSLSGPVGYLMTMTGHHFQAAWIIGGSALMNIFLNAILIPNFRLNGAAIATTISIIVCNVSMIYLIWKYLKINTLFFYPYFIKCKRKIINGLGTFSNNSY